MADTGQAAESAPLLRDPESGQEAPNGNAHPSFAQRLTSVVQEPLTPLTKVLLIAGLVLLLLSSIFVGLFAGAQHKLNVGNGGGGNGGEKPGVTYTQTQTQTMTATRTSTSIITTTAPGGPEPTRTPGNDACLSTDCIVLSADILTSLDTSQDPCENFYDFATGGWTKTNPIPADKGSYGRFNALTRENQQVIREILESDVVPTTTSSYDEKILKKLRGLYASCLDEDVLNYRGSEPLFQFVKTMRNLFRGKTTEIGVSTSSEERAKHLTAALSYLHSRGVGGLFEFEIDGDVGTDPNAMTLWFSQPELGLPSKEYYEDESIREFYQDVIEKLLLTLADDDDDNDLSVSQPLATQDTAKASRLWPPWPWPPWDDPEDDHPLPGPPKPKPDPKERAKQLAKGVLEFESDIAKASLDLDIIQDDPIFTYNPMPIHNLTSSLPQIQFSNYFASKNPRAYPERIIITYPAYVHSLSLLLEDTSNDVIESYLVIRSALTLAPNLGLNTEAYKAARSLQETLQGIKPGSVGDRSELCIGKVEGTLGFAAGRYFVNQTFSGNSKDKATKVIMDIVDTFKQSLKQLDWMDKESATAAAEKADAIRVKVGFPVSPNTLDPRSIANYYTLVDIKKDKFFENMLSAASSDDYKMWQQLGKRRNPDAWEMYPSMVNAYFNPPANEIVFPAGILQPPFFQQDWPAYMSYGSFGQVASHELTHAFDSAGRLYNQDGKLEEWWTNATSEGFNVRQKCIAEQYSSYTVDDGKGGKVHVNGNLTSGENIGDSGIIQAYRAWKAQFHTSYASGKEYILPGLNYTREQLFFLSFARSWAVNIRPEAAVQRVRTDPHSPNRYRVDGTLTNVPEFAEAFNCAKGTKLNPPMEERCLLW